MVDSGATDKDVWAAVFKQAYGHASSSHKSRSPKRPFYKSGSDGSSDGGFSRVFDGWGGGYVGSVGGGGGGSVGSFDGGYRSSLVQISDDQY